MYEHFNPLHLSDAWWQHLLMLLVSAILGYIIGYRSGNTEIEDLEARLAGLDNDLDDCLKSKKATPVAVATPVVAAAAPVVAASLAAAPVKSGKPDDLKVVEGIGPKIEQLLHNDGIKTFAELAETAPERIKAILDAAGPRFQMHDPGTWPQQSALARDGRWDDLKTLQDQLNKGKAE